MTEGRIPRRDTSLPTPDRGRGALTEARMSAPRDPRRSVEAGVEREYYYRRRLTPRELLPALGIGIGAGAVAFYLAKVLFERTPLLARAEQAPRRRLSPTASLATHPDVRDRR